MKIGFNVPDKWVALIDREAANDGHSNRGAIIRKILKERYSEELKQQEAQTVTDKATQEASAK